MMTISMQTSANPVLRCDFNMLGPDKRLTVLRQSWDLVMGQKVVLQDADGNWCYGRVREIHPNRYGVRALLSTWRDGGPADGESAQ